MRNRLLIYSMMFLFTFILPSFTKIPDKDDSSNNVLQTASDSITVNVQFQNPQLTITDNNGVLEGKFNLQMLSNKELLEVAKKFNDNITFLTELQERRYGPVMDQLQQRTGYSVGQINKFIRQKNNQSTCLAVGSILSMFLLITLYVKSYRRLNGSAIAYVFMLFVCYLIILLVASLLWPALMGQDYIRFYELIKLSP